MAVCNNCGGPKPDDQFRACPGCREDWRLRGRKPGGTAERIDDLTLQRDSLIKAAEGVLSSRSVQPYRLVTPYRELQLAVDKAKGR